MNTVDNKLNLEVRLLNLKNIIQKISSFDQDAALYFTQIDEMMKEISSRDLSYLRLDGNMEMEINFEQKYLDIIKKLDELESQICDYASFYDIYYDVLRIKGKLNNEITDEDICENVSKILLLLDKIKNIKVDDYSKIEYIINSLYEIVLYMIKIELLRNGKSVLYDKIKVSQNDMIMIRLLIKKELDEIAYRERSNFLNDTLNKLGIDITNSDLFNEQIIFLLAVINNDEIESQLFSKLDEITKNINEQIDTKEVIDSEIIKIREQISSKKKEKRNQLLDGCFHVILSLVLVGSLSLGGFGIFKLARRNTSTVRRNATINSYSSLDSQYLEECNVYTEYKEGDIFLQEVYPEDGEKRKIMTYWIRPSDDSRISEDVKDYLNYTSLFYDNNISADEISVYPNDMEFLSDEYYTVVGEITEVNKKDKMVSYNSNFSFLMLLILYYFGCLLLLTIIIRIIYGRGEPLGDAFYEIFQSVFDYSGIYMISYTKKDIDKLQAQLKEKKEELNISLLDIDKLEKLYQEINTKYGELMEIVQKRKGKTRKLSM